MALTGITRTPGLRSHDIAVYPSQHKYYLAPSCLRMLPRDKDTDVSLLLHKAIMIIYTQTYSGLCCRFIATLGELAWGYSCALNAIAAAIGLWLLAAHRKSIPW